MSESGAEDEATTSDSKQHIQHVFLGGLEKKKNNCSNIEYNKAAAFFIEAGLSKMSDLLKVFVSKATESSFWRTFRTTWHRPALLEPESEVIQEPIRRRHVFESAFLKSGGTASLLLVPEGPLVCALLGTGIKVPDLKHLFQ